MIEIAVQGTQCVGSAHYGCVNNRVIVGIGQHDAGRRAWENDLRDVFGSKIAEILGYLSVRKPR